MAARYTAAMTQNHPLPLIWLLSDARNDARLEEALCRLPPGSGFVYRHYHLAERERRARYIALYDRAKRRGHTVVLAGDEGWCSDGTYGSVRRGDTGLFLATAHDAAELGAAARAGADAVFLSPVFATASHPAAPTLGREHFLCLANRSDIPVIALGGMTAERARELGWPRWGAIDGLTPDSAEAHTAATTD